MKLIKKYGLVIYWILLICDCALCIINLKTTRIYTKPLLIPLLALYFFVNTRRGKHSTSKMLIYSSLFAAWIGDLLLLWFELIHKDHFLLMGFTSLILAISVYGLLFKRMYPIKIKDCQEAFLTAVATSVVFIVFYKFLSPTQLSYFRFPILIGMVAIVVSMAFAANLIQDKVRNNIAMQFFLPGLIIFTISVGILMASRFLLTDAEFLPAVIVLTYGYGQMLIMRGFTKYLKA
jgi:YhhN family